jgi:hypothetical protein
VPIAFTDAATGYQNAGTSATATLPAGAVVGGVVLAFTALSDTTVGDPSISGGGAGGSWTLVGSGVLDDNVLRTKVWSRVLASGDPGATITTSWTSSAKGGLILATYSGTHPTTPVGTPATEVEAGTDGTHDAPGITPTGEGWWVVDLVAQRSSACTTITAPGTRTERAEQLGFGAGTVCQIVADSAAALTRGVSSGAATYTFNEATANAGGWSVPLVPAPAPLLPDHVRRRAHLLVR